LNRERASVQVLAAMADLILSGSKLWLHVIQTVCPQGKVHIAG
jgi:hypothetical protein